MTRLLPDGQKMDMNGTFHEPQVRLNRIYTRTGDEGETSLVNGRRLGKDDLRIEAYGTVDELNAFLGLAAVSVKELKSAYPRLEELGAALRRVQHELFNLGSLLATDPDKVYPKQPQVTEREVTQLESDIDAANRELEELKSFVLPGGCRLNAELHVARTVCRRAERVTIALSRKEGVPGAAIHYLNRLSDALFVWSRWASRVMGVEEVLWKPNEAASARQGP